MLLITSPAISLRVSSLRNTGSESRPRWLRAENGMGIRVMSKLKILSSCRYIASPFSNLEDLSWRLLLRKLGVHLCFNTSLIKAVNFEGLDNVSSLLGNQEDRPLVVQVRDGNASRFRGYQGSCSLFS